MALLDEDQVSAYDFELPLELIAQQPAPERDASRLLALIGEEAPSHCLFRDLTRFLRAGDLLVRNNTKVIPARLKGHRASGGKTELLLVRRIGAMSWECLARPASHLKEGKTVSFGQDELFARVLAKHDGGFVDVEFRLPAFRSEARMTEAPGTEESEAFWPVLDKLGETPLPPYIDRDEAGPTERDRERYQTVYASAPGAVAAPTAGLHFTPDLFQKLETMGVKAAELTLHVGPGTFRPVKADRISEHQMDVEFYDIPSTTAQAVRQAKAEGRRVIAVGTTATRALEASAENGQVEAGPGKTQIFIRPPYRFRAIDGLVTNFHLPKSTLLMLVSALTSRERLLSAYNEAVRMKYRFYSFGDAMLILA